MTDLELYVMRWIDFAHIQSTPEAARMIATAYDLSVDSVRSRLSRTDTPQNKALIARRLIKSTSLPAAYDQLNNQISSNNHLFEISKSLDVVLGKEVCAVFRSDMHLPRPRWDAFDLELQILSDLKPRYISAMNDMMDNEGYGRWNDNRAPFESMWSKDIGQMRQTEKHVYNALIKAATSDDGVIPQAIGVNGNHDMWYRTALYDRLSGDATKIWADYVSWLREDCNVLVLDAERENVVTLSPGLKWWHGQFISSNQTANAKNTLEQLSEDGVVFSVVVGHTHRPFQTTVLGRNFYNSPCLCQIESVPYLKRDPKNWGLGITVNWFVPGTRQERGEIVHFKEEGKHLVARLNGKEYRTLLAKD
jgi:predicted phosphodiesterase